MNFFQKIGWAKINEDPFETMEDAMKKYFSEIITLREIRQELLNTISDLRSENVRLRKELRDLKEL